MQHFQTNWPPFSCFRKGYKEEGPIDKIPDEILVHILALISQEDLWATVAKVSRRFYRLATASVLWRRIEFLDERKEWTWPKVVPKCGPAKFLKRLSLAPNNLAQAHECYPFKSAELATLLLKEIPGLESIAVFDRYDQLDGNLFRSIGETRGLRELAIHAVESKSKRQSLGFDLMGPGIARVEKIVLRGSANKPGQTMITPGNLEVIGGWGKAIKRIILEEASLVEVSREDVERLFKRLSPTLETFEMSLRGIDPAEFSVYGKYTSNDWEEGG